MWKARCFLRAFHGQVERVESLPLAFQAFHGRHFHSSLRLCRSFSFLPLGKRPSEAIRFRSPSPRIWARSVIRSSKRFAEPRVRVLPASTRKTPGSLSLSRRSARRVQRSPETETSAPRLQPARHVADLVDRDQVIPAPTRHHPPPVGVGVSLPPVAVYQRCRRGEADAPLLPARSDARGQSKDGSCPSRNLR